MNHNQSDDPLINLHSTTANDLDAVLDIEAGLRESLVGVHHYHTGVDLDLNVEAGLHAIVPTREPAMPTSSAPMRSAGTKSDVAEGPGEMSGAVVSWPEHVHRPGQLRELAMSFRSAERRRTDAALIQLIRADVQEYRRVAVQMRQHTPPAPLDELLPLMGWLIYEASWETLQRLPTAWDRPSASAEDRARYETNMQYLYELADAARGLPWPEFAPRALGAIRALALAESKRDTMIGYDAAWVMHAEGRSKYREFRDTHGTDPARQRSVRDLDEVLLQLALAETGTACRVSERVISRWAESYAGESEDWWIQRMFRDVSNGAAVGELALDTARQIQQHFGYVNRVTEDRLALLAALRNPGIMTARAALLLLVLGREMQRLGSRPRGHSTWADWERHTLARFEKAYQAIEDPTIDPAGSAVEIREDLAHQLIYLRVSLALLKPGYHLPSKLSFHQCLSHATLDRDALEALSAYLAGEDGEQIRAQGIIAATMPAFIRGIQECRELGVDDDGFNEWRRRWVRPNHLLIEPGHWDRVLAASA